MSSRRTAARISAGKERKEVTTEGAATLAALETIDTTLQGIDTKLTTIDTTLQGMQTTLSAIEVLLTP